MSVLDLFWNLASLDENERVEAAEKLIVHLQDAQNAHVSQMDKSSANTCDSIESIDVFCAPDVAYSIKRLCKGLVSSRQGARQGFSIALSALIQIVAPFIPVRVMVELIRQHCEPSAGMKGYEERDQIYGRVFGYGVILESGMFSRSSLQMEDVQIMYADLSKYAHSKPYLKELCYDLIYLMNDEIKSNNRELWEKVCTYLLSTDSGLLVDPNNEMQWSIEILPIALQLNIEQNVFSKENANLLAKMVKDSTEFAHPRVHTALERLLKTYLLADGNKNIFQAFWQTIVEDCLCVGALEKKYLALRLFQISFKQSTSVICSEKVLKCLFTSAENPSLSLHKLAKNIFADICKAAEGDRELAMTLVAIFSGFPTLQSSPSGKQLMVSLLQSSKKESDTSERSALKLMQKLIEGCQMDDKQATKCIADQLVILLRGVKGSQEAVELVVEFLTSTIDTNKHKLWSLLAELSGKRLADDAWSTGMVNEDTHILQYAYKKLFANKKESKKVKKYLNCEKGDEKKKSRAMLVTLILLISSLSTTNEEEDWDDLLQDLLQCFSSSKKSEGDDLNPADVLCDVLVSLLSKQAQDFSRLTRVCVEEAFRNHCHEMSLTGLNNVLSVFDPVYDSAVIEEDADDDDVSDMDEEVDQETLAKIKEALGDALDNDESQELSDLDDDQMKALGFDDKLAQIFKDRQMEQKEKSNLLNLLMDFRNKALELIHIYVTMKTPINYDVMSTVVTSLLRSAAMYSNPTSVQQNLLKQTPDTGGEWSKETLATQIKYISELKYDQRNQLINKMIKLAKLALPQQPRQKLSLGDELALFECISEVETLLTGTSEKKFSFCTLPGGSSKEVVAVCCKVIATAMSHLLSNPENIVKVSHITSRYVNLHLSKSGRGSIPGAIFILLIDSINPELAWKLFMDKICTIRLSEKSLSKFNQSQIFHLVHQFAQKLKSADNKEIASKVFKVAVEEEKLLKSVQPQTSKTKKLLKDVNFVFKKCRQISPEL